MLLTDEGALLNASVLSASVDLLIVDELGAVALLQIREGGGGEVGRGLDR